MNQLEEYHHLLTRSIESNCHSPVPLIGEITKYLLGGGKRIRARLCWLIASAFKQQLDKQQLDKIVKLGCAIEYTHLATLMHDDLVDQSLLRRERETVHLRWGYSEAVLVGDFIYSRAFEILVGISNLPVLEHLAVTTNSLAEGEVEQLVAAQSADRTEAEYLQVIEKKTGALFGCACASAVALVGADRAQSRSYYQLGLGIGMAYQIIDDLLDYQSDASRMGKNPGDDFREGKFTLPLIHLYANSSTDQQQTIKQMLANPDDHGLAEIVKLMQQAGSFVASLNKAKELVSRSTEMFQTLPASFAKNQLLNEIASMLDRTA